MRMMQHNSFVQANLQSLDAPGSSSPKPIASAEIHCLADEHLSPAIIEAARKKVFQYWQPVVPNLQLEQLELDYSGFTSEWWRTWYPIQFRAGNYLYLVHDLDKSVLGDSYFSSTGDSNFYRIPAPDFVIPAAKEAIFHSLQRAPELFPGLSLDQIVVESGPTVSLTLDGGPFFEKNEHWRYYHECSVQFKVKGVPGAFYTVRTRGKYLEFPNIMHNKKEKLVLPGLEEWCSKKSNG